MKKNDQMDQRVQTEPFPFEFLIPRCTLSGTYKQTAKGRPCPSQLYADDYKNPDFEPDHPFG